MRRGRRASSGPRLSLDLSVWRRRHYLMITVIVIIIIIVDIIIPTVYCYFYYHYYYYYYMSFSFMSGLETVQGWRDRATMQC